MRKESIMSLRKHKRIKAEDFDRAFEEGDVIEHLDLKSAKVRYPVQRISIDFPVNVLHEVDLEAAKIGVTRTSLIKMWVAEQLHKQHE
jgi:hypothetical protein